MKHTSQRKCHRPPRWAYPAMLSLLGLLGLRHAVAQSPGVEPRDYSEEMGWSSLLKLEQFRPQAVPTPSLENSPSIPARVSDGRVLLSVQALVRAVVENNLTVESARHTVSLADTDVLKARAGQTPSGTEAAAIPRSLGSVSFGSGGGGGSRNSAEIPVTFSCTLRSKRFA